MQRSAFWLGVPVVMVDAGAAAVFGLDLPFVLVLCVAAGLWAYCVWTRTGRHWHLIRQFRRWHDR
jgi:hypothetical protein